MRLNRWQGAPPLPGGGGLNGKEIDMKPQKTISILFYLTAAYDGILGIVFLISPLAVFAWFDVTPPNHIGYVQFPAMLLIVFAAMFIAIARHPADNRNLIPYGIGLKVSYCLAAFGHWIAGGIPMMWKPFAIIDAICIILFAWAYKHLMANPES
jgi:hypothetical protein